MGQYRSSRYVLGAAGGAVVSLDAQGRICDWGSDAHRLFGLEAQRVLGKPLAAFVASRRRDQVDRAVARALAGRQARVATPTLAAADQPPLEVLLAMGPVTGRDGPDAARVICAVRDITSEMRALRGLQAYERRLQWITDHTSDGVYELDRSDPPRLAYVNDRLAAMLGISIDQLLEHGMLFEDRLGLDDGDRLARARQQGGPWPVSVSWRRADGQPVEVLVYEDVIDEPTGERRTQGLVVEVARQRMGGSVVGSGAAGDLDGLPLSTAPARDPGDLSAAAVDAIRQPLAAVVGFAETLLAHVDTLAPEQVRALLERLNASAARMAGLVEDLDRVEDLDLVEAATEGPVDLGGEPDVAELVGDVVTSVRPQEAPETGGPSGPSRVPLTWDRVAAFVRDRVDELDLTHEELAERANVSLGTLRRLTAESPGSVRTSSLRRIADALGLPFEQVLAQLAAAPPEDAGPS